MYIDSVTLTLGDEVSIPGIGDKKLVRIEQTRHDQYMLSLDEGDGLIVLEVKTDGDERLPEPPPHLIVDPDGDGTTEKLTRTLVTHADSLELKDFDMLSLPDAGALRVGAISQPGTNRFAVRLDKKFAPSVVIGITTRS